LPDRKSRTILSRKSNEARREVKMQLRWLVCGQGNVHIVGPCPDCYATEGGLLLGTVASTYKGRISANCVDCGKIVDYYVDASEGRIWKLEPVDAKGMHVEI
jgi:hypothetical protein